MRKMRRYKQALDRSICEEILRKAPRGVLAVSGDDGYPYAVPLNFYFDPEAETIYFHGAHEGHKIDAIKREPKVSFCVTDGGTLDESGDFYYVNSVIAFGQMHFVEDPEKSIAITREIGLKYYPDAESAEQEVEKAGARALCLALKIDTMTGKRVHEK
jgi:nitroimidazol reductase NimA-like FMN-containing flavoprotein (pyridoxamine 5'-phosphate oxidase superfamily)